MSMAMVSDHAGPAASEARGMLTMWAPKLLRELYERDIRRPFCPAALWLGPFLAAEEAAPNLTTERFSAAAVMTALLQGPTSNKQRCSPCLREK